VNALYDPRTTDDLITFYFSWIVILFLFHIALDWHSEHTHASSWFKINKKISELYTAASVASSLLLGLIVLHGFQTHPLFETNTMLVPLMLSALSGVIIGISSLIPKPL